MQGEGGETKLRSAAKYIWIGAFLKCLCLLVNILIYLKRFVDLLVYQLMLFSDWTIVRKTTLLQRCYIK